jgi:hypothetical protein
MRQSISQFSKEFTHIVKFLNSKAIFAIAFLVRFCIRQPKKVFPQDFLQMLIITSFRAKACSLSEMVSILKDLNPLSDVTQQSLSERINTESCKELCKSALEYAIQSRVFALPLAKEITPQLLRSFSRVLIEDSSKVELSEELQEIFRGQGGGASKSALKMHTIFDLASKRFVLMEEYSGTTSDSTLGVNRLKMISKGDLLIHDLAFFRFESFREMDEKGAFFLSRLPSSVLIRTRADGPVVTFSELFDNYCTSDGSKLDTTVYLGDERYQVRLVAFRAPEEVKNTRLRRIYKANRSRKSSMKNETVRRQGFTIFITNVPKTLWSLDVVGTIYRLRWQIELIYKSWKSQLKIHHLRGVKEERIRALLYAKWLAIVIVCSVFELVNWYAKKELEREASFHKLVNWLMIRDRFEILICKGLEKQLLQKILNECEKCMCKERRNTNQSTLEKVEKHEAYYVNS